MQRWENEEQNELLRKGTEREGNQSMKLQSKRPRMPSLLLESAERRLVLDCLKLNAYWQVYWDQRVRRRKRWIPVNSVWPTKESKSWPQVQYFQQCSCFPDCKSSPSTAHAACLHQATISIRNAANLSGGSWFDKLDPYAIIRFRGSREDRADHAISCLAATQNPFKGTAATARVPGRR